MVYENEAFGVEAGDLPGEFRADGAAGAGDHHALSLDVLRDRAHVGLDLRATQEVLDVEIAGIPQTDGTGDQVGQARKDLDVRPRGLADAVDAGDLVGGGRGDGDHDLGDVVFLGQLRSFRDASQYRVPLDRHAFESGIIVHEADWLDGERRGPAEFADEHVGGLAGSNKQDPLGTGICATRRLGQDSQREAERQHHGYCHDPSPYDHRSGHKVGGAPRVQGPGHDDKEEESHRANARLGESHCLGEAHIASDNGVRSGEPVDGDVDDHRDRRENGEVRGPHREAAYRSRVAEIEDDIVGRDNGAGVHGNRGNMAPAQPTCQL